MKSVVQLSPDLEGCVALYAANQFRMSHAVSVHFVDCDGVRVLDHVACRSMAEAADVHSHINVRLDLTDGHRMRLDGCDAAWLGLLMARAAAIGADRVYLSTRRPYVHQAAIEMSRLLGCMVTVYAPLAYADDAQVEAIAESLPGCIEAWARSKSAGAVADG